MQALNGVRVVARTGRSERDLTLDSLLTADVKYVESRQRNEATGAAETVRVAEVPRYTIERLNVNLPAAQRDFPEQLAGMTAQGLRFDSGTLGLSGSGGYTSQAVTFDVKGGVDRMTLTRQPAARQPPPRPCSATTSSTSTRRAPTRPRDLRRGRA